MRALVLLLILLLSTPTIASHHRGHALARLNGMDIQFLIINFHVVRLQENCDLTDAQDLQLRKIRHYSDRVLDGLPIWRLEAESGDLDKSRRQLTQPSTDAPDSASAILSAIAHHARTLIGSCPEWSYDINGIIQRNTLAWATLDQAAWHVNDAIREEMYSDINFICSGPNNHCE